MQRKVQATKQALKIRPFFLEIMSISGYTIPIESFFAGKAGRMNRTQFRNLPQGHRACLWHPHRKGARMHGKDYGVPPGVSRWHLLAAAAKSPEEFAQGL